MLERSGQEAPVSVTIVKEGLEQTMIEAQRVVSQETLKDAFTPHFSLQALANGDLRAEAGRAVRAQGDLEELNPEESRSCVSAYWIRVSKQRLCKVGIYP